MSKSKISRRDFLRVGGLAATASALAACDLAERQGTPTPASRPTDIGKQATLTATPAAQLSPQPIPPSSPDDETRILHTVRRMSFGINPATLERARKIGLESWFEEQLNPGNPKDSPENRILDRLELLKAPVKELIAMQDQHQVVGQFILSTLIHHIQSPWQVYEMMVDFWTNHLNIFLADVLTRVLKIYDDRDVIRKHALGSFRELLQASAHSPAMLFYLDQALSTRQSPNENYARELLELHTLGVNGGYTQQDVQETARALTGWGIVGPRDFFRTDKVGTFIFRPRLHDDGVKQILDFTIPAGSGQKGGERLLDFLASHTKTARFISRKLAVRFIADEPPDSAVDHLEQAFLNSSGDIRTVLRALIAAPEFIASAKGKLKRPLEFFVSLLIATQAKLSPDPTSIRELVNVLRTSGQMPHFWPAPDGYPDYAAWWTTSSGMLNRWNFALQTMHGDYRAIRIPLEDLMRDAASPADLVDMLSLQFLGERLPDLARQVLLDFSAAGDLHALAPSIAGLILGSPYFQMR